MITRITWFVFGVVVGAAALFVYQKWSVIQKIPATAQIAGGLSDVVEGFKAL
jgi:predicted negative regulator of RcsB-dependent stress response